MTTDSYAAVDDSFVASSDGDTSYYADTPQERLEEESIQGAILAASYPIMPNVAAWFTEQIEATDSRRNIKAYAESHRLDIDKCSLAFDIVRELLEAKAQDFEQFKEES